LKFFSQSQQNLRIFKTCSGEDCSLIEEKVAAAALPLSAWAPWLVIWAIYALLHWLFLGYLCEWISNEVCPLYVSIRVFPTRAVQGGWRKFSRFKLFSRVCISNL